MLGHLDAAPDLAETTRDEVALALWCHDAVYDPRAHDNEEKSAALALAAAAGLGLASDLGARVAALVLATRHDATPATAPAQLMADLDLAILGADAAAFAAYDAAIRAEYACVADAAFRAGRAAVLRAFLARPAIYATAWGRQRWEASARANLTRAISNYT